MTAARVVEDIASRLTDPHRVASHAWPGDTDRPGWAPLSLNDGHPGVALLHAELAATDTAHRQHAHDHLAAATAAALDPANPRLYHGIAAVAFAAHAAARAHPGYRTLLSTLDSAILGQVVPRARRDRARVLAGAPIGSFRGYDVITGATGLGRYLLARYRATDDARTRQALTAVLDTLTATALSPDVTVDDVKVPAWWVHHGVHSGSADGHLNLGLAHGIFGPLALLSVAHRDGVRVAGHTEAIDRIATLALAHRLEDRSGPRWPLSITAAGLSDPALLPPRQRDLWCYGSAGAGRALFLAGRALGRAGWRSVAHATLTAAFRTADTRNVHDFALCHGWAGLLRIADRMALDTGDTGGAVGYRAIAGSIAARIVAAFDPAAPFGYRYRHPAATEPEDRPGFLEGAAGIALALHGHVTGGPPATDWDAALLLA